MKKYFVAKKVVRFIVALLVCTILINGFNKITNKLIAEENNTEIENLKHFIDNFSVLPNGFNLNNGEDIYEEEFILYNIPLSEELQKYCYEIAKEHNLGYTLILGLIWTESEFKSEAKCKNQGSSGYSVGLCQINNQYIKWYKELLNVKDYDIHDDKQNIKTGIVVLRVYKDYWISQGITSEEDLWCYTLGSYNRGIEGYKKYIKNTGKINTDYDKKVLKNKIKLEEDGGM
ncbi:MAG: transglycosylase SLT domain-containing protein [Tissierellia bacterium]|nr:transglycosylase SLT domain-containing protein [Tissierellia bacterium]